MNTTQRSKTLFGFILITSLFFLWGFANNLNPILIPHLKKSFTLNNVQATLVDSADRIMYSSDWPVCKVAATYASVVEIVASYFSSFSSSEKEKIFGQNAIEFYNIQTENKNAGINL
jgi:hypothetical protein